MSKSTPSSKNGDLPVIYPGEIKSNSKQRKTGRGRLRAIVLIGVHLLILVHVTHFWVSGSTFSPLEPSEAMYTIELGQVNAGAIFFGLAIASTFVFGRFFCGWGCHLVALQDLSGHLLRRIGIRPKPLRSRLLTLVPFALAFYMFFWPTVKRLWQGVPHPGFSNHLMTAKFWDTFPGAAVSILTFVVCGGLIIYLLGNKGFCTYACPYGAFFSVADRLAVGRIRVTNACHQCGQCTAHCTSNVQVHAEVRDFGMVVDPGCMKCMDCVSVCPNDALYFGFTQKSDSPPTKLLSSRESDPIQGKKTYDYSITEELIGLVVVGVAVFGLRGLYDITPLLLSVAAGVITAYGALQGLRMIQRSDHKIQNIRVKRNRQVTPIGILTAAGFCLWFVFVIHSVFVQYHRYRGRDYLNRNVVTWNELVTRRVQPQLTDNDLLNIEKAQYSYQTTDRIGLLPVKEAKLGLAIASLMKDDFESAEGFLRQAYQIDPNGVREMLGEFLVSQNRWDDAAELY